jgi:uncharacterized protein YkwD
MEDGTGTRVGQMRRVLLTTMLAAAVASGCGGGSDRSAGGSTSGSGSTSSTSAGSSAVSDGQIGGALLARPGRVTVHGHTQKITGRSILPPSTKHALGAEDNCADQDLQPTTDNLPQVGDAIFCLMNAMRANAGVPALKLQDLLTQASIGHSQDMVANKYFAHDSQDGRDVVARLNAVHYIPTSGDWVIGENLVWGSGVLGTPKALVNAWMNSTEHRENLLSGDFQEVGMGVVYGTPSPTAPDGITVTTDFGTRPGVPAGTSGAPSSSSSGSSSATVDLANLSGGNANNSTAARAASAKARARTRARRVAARRRRALRRCARMHGRRRHRCVRAARKIR